MTPEYIFFFRFTAHRDLSFHTFLYSITRLSAAPQTTLCGGPGPRFEPSTGDLEVGTPTMHYCTTV